MPMTLELKWVPTDCLVIIWAVQILFPINAASTEAEGRVDLQGYCTTFLLTKQSRLKALDLDVTACVSDFD